MKRIRSSLLPVAASIVFLFIISFSPAAVDATEYLVGPARAFATIQAAISSPTFTSGDSIVVDPGFYFGPITLPYNMTLKGTETARTFLSGSGSGTVITANGTIAASISNFTFINASTGILVSNNTSAISINNNVFQVGTGGTAITIQNSPATQVFNNTFFQNGTALSSNSDIEIVNNIFSDYSTAITGPPFSSLNIANNAFSGDLTSGPTGTYFVPGDPLFVDISRQDFHLKSGSPCINAGRGSTDIGAYGGLQTDVIPFPVAGLSITPSTSSVVELSWLLNNCYLMTNGIYSIKFGTVKGGPRTDHVEVNAPSSTGEVDLPIPPPPSLTAPVLDPPSPRDSQLVLTWSAVPGATGYVVYHGISSLDENDPIDAGNNTSYTLSGLSNGPANKVQVAVQAYYQLQYFFVVDAFYGADATALAHPSADSPEVSVTIGTPQIGPLSNIQIDFPEAVTTYPALPNRGGGCFIATAAYGDYSAPEVRALRAFRDRYLLASAPGRMFVRWYYQHGPAAAALLNSHPGYKPAVRTALMPVVGFAIFMTRTSMLLKAIVFLVFGTAIVFGFFRKRLSRTGGQR